MDAEELFMSFQPHANALLSDDPLVNKVISRTEEEYKQFQTQQIQTQEEDSRLAEEKEIKRRLARLRKQLNRARNVKNPGKNKVNEQRSKRRKKLRKEICMCTIRLREIEDERNIF